MYYSGRYCTFAFALLFVSACSTMHPEGLLYIHPDFSTQMSVRSAPQVSSLQPTFQWESVQAYLRRKGEAEERIANLSKALYDIKIYHAKYWKPTEVNKVKGDYARYNLTATSHTLETPLLPDRTYIVLVRCFYQIGNKQDLVPWSKHRGHKSEWEQLLTVNALLTSGMPPTSGSMPYVFHTPAADNEANSDDVGVVNSKN